MPRRWLTWFERPQLSEPPRSRESFGLDPRRHVYLCPQTLYKFHPEFDTILVGILTTDPLADIVIIDGRVPNWTKRLRDRFRRTLPIRESVSSHHIQAHRMPNSWTC